MHENLVRSLVIGCAIAGLTLAPSAVAGYLGAPGTNFVHWIFGSGHDEQFGQLGIPVFTTLVLVINALLYTALAYSVISVFRRPRKRGFHA